ncbi:MAG: DUF1667 domain-containing protein [Clostridiales bacterium]|nr:DUF1667 domain-containing protein [Clostridiales bacterium]
MEQTITCISCPVGCRMTVTIENGQFISVSGNTCKRGEAYARQECIAPQRMVTAVIPVQGATTPLSVKTRTPIPKDRISACMKALADVVIAAPVRTGEVVLADVCGTGVDIIATKTVE